MSAGPGISANSPSRKFGRAGDIAAARDYLNSFAQVFIDGKPAGEIRFPGGELELTPFCRPGRKQVLSMLVIAMPLSAVTTLPRGQGVLNSMSGSEYQGNVTLKGLCGDVYLVGTPAGPRLADFKIATSTRLGEITFDAALRDLAAGGQFVLSARIDDGGREVASFKSKSFTAADLNSAAPLWRICLL